MAQTPENQFIDGVHQYLPKEGPNRVYWMKNHNEFNSGIADCWYSGFQSDLWIEYKFISVPVRDNTVVSLVDGSKPVLSELQQHWLRMRYEEGRATGVIVGSTKGGVWLPDTEWALPISAGEFREKLMSRKQLAECICALVGVT